MLTTLAYLNSNEIRLLLPYIVLLRITLISSLIKNGDKGTSTSHILALMGVLRRLDWITKKRMLNKHNNIPLTRISNVSSDNPPYSNIEHGIIEGIRKKLYRKLNKIA
jgi:hypothetical protein